MSALFELENVGMRYGAHEVLHGVTLVLDRPQMVALAGPNAAGKSTLLGILAGLRRGYTGSCRLHGVETPAWRRRDFAREAAFVPQSLRLDFPFTAEQVILMGRTPYAGGLFESPRDRDALERALDLTDTRPIRSRDFRTLSGGERQRVVLASALAQEPKILLLDEPTTFVDLEHQLSIYSLLRRLAAEGMLVVAVTHDLNLAAHFSERILVLKAGRLLADATPAEALSAEMIRRAFNVGAEWIGRPGGRSWIAYGD
jgi:iron complex transport system ATP-binding protein